MEKYSVSMHRGIQISQKHNNRTERFAEGQTHIDLSRKHVNVIDIPIKEAYHELFDEAVREYNKRRNKPSREIDDYYAKIHNMKNKHEGYEIIVQVGDMNSYPDPEEAEKIFREYIQSFQERNPNMYVFGAYIHLDEATPHLHLDYIPVCHNQERGPETAVSHRKALIEQGFEERSYHDNVLIQWTAEERRKIIEITKEHGFGVKNILQESRDHMEKEQYIQMVRLQGLKKEVKKGLDIKRRIDKYNETHVQGDLKQILDAYQNDILAERYKKLQERHPEKIAQLEREDAYRERKRGHGHKSEEKTEI